MSKLQVLQEHLKKDGAGASASTCNPTSMSTTTFEPTFSGMFSPKKKKKDLLKEHIEKARAVGTPITAPKEQHLVKHPGISAVKPLPPGEAPGPPPRPGLEWSTGTHRWVRSGVGQGGLPASESGSTGTSGGEEDIIQEYNDKLKAEFPHSSDHMYHAFMFSEFLKSHGVDSYAITANDRSAVEMVDQQGTSTYVDPVGNDLEPKEDVVDILQGKPERYGLKELPEDKDRIELVQTLMTDLKKSWVEKTQGVAEQPGPAPGPAPSPELSWNPISHRWVNLKRVVEQPKEHVLPDDFKNWYLKAFASIKDVKARLGVVEELPLLPLGTYDGQGKHHDCIGNSFKFARENGEQIMTGYLIETGNEKNFSRHTWNMKDGKVIEHTPFAGDWNASNVQYRGLPVKMASYDTVNEFDKHFDKAVKKKVSLYQPPVIIETKAEFETRILNNAERLKKNFSGEAEDRWSEYATKLGISEEELKHKTVAKLQELVNKSQIWIRTPGSNITKILKDGRFKNISETHRMSPGKHKGMRLGEYLEDRVNCEDKIFGFSDTSKRPIYGYLSDNPDGRLHEFYEGSNKEGLSDWLSGYGDCRIKIKSSVKDRTTFTMHDSLDTNITMLNGEGARVIPYPIDHIGPEIVLGNMFDPRKEYKSINEAETMYSEVQMHNGVTTSDIDEIVFEGGLPEESTLLEFDRLGIKYRKMQERKEAIGRWIR